MNSPRPTELMAHMRNPSSVSKLRNLYCRHYDECLDFAVRKNWEGWSCHECPLFREEAPELKPNLRDFATAGRKE